MAHDSPDDLRLLHTLRCVGTSSTAHLADRAGMPAADAESHLIDLGVAGLVAHAAGTFGGWSITEQGRVADSEFVAAELSDAGCRAGVQAAFDRFVELNPEVLQTCTAWQLRPFADTAEINDHSDPRYDGQVLRRLAGLERRGQVVCTELANALTRFDGYGPRLAIALERALSGQDDFVAENSNSFHSLWFQLHEDLLVTLGSPRT